MRIREVSVTLDLPARKPDSSSDRLMADTVSCEEEEECEVGTRLLAFHSSSEPGDPRTSPEASDVL